MSEKKSGIGFLKGLIFEDQGSVEEASTETTGSTHPNAGVAKTTPQVPTATPRALFISSGGADPEVRKLLEKDIQEAAKPAYSEFASLNDSMASVIIDERTRIQATLAALQPRGLTIDQVIVDIDECLAALDKKEKDGLAASADARKRRVGSKEKDIADINHQLEDLRKSISELETNRTNIEAQISDETKSLDETEAKFTNTIAAYRVELSGNRMKISNFKKGV